MIKIEEFPAELLVANIARAIEGPLGYGITLRLDPFFLVDDVVEPVIRLNRACLPVGGVKRWVNHTFQVPDNAEAGGIRGTIEFGSWSAPVVCHEIDFGDLAGEGISVELTLSLLLSELRNRFEDVHIRLPTVFVVDS